MESIRGKERNEIVTSGQNSVNVNKPHYIDASEML